jgi:hypothetical protein
MLYSLSQRFYFRELSRTIPAGQTVELDPEIGEKYMRQWPGLLKPVRQTTQAQPQAVRKKPSNTLSKVVAMASRKKKPAKTSQS